MPSLPQCTAEQVLDVVEAVVLSIEPVDLARIVEYTVHAKDTVAKAILVASMLGLVEKETGGKWIAKSVYHHYLMAATENRRIDLLRFALEAMPEYRFFKNRLEITRDGTRAGRETRAKFSFSNHESEVKETLSSLGQYCGSLLTPAKISDAFLARARKRGMMMA